MRIVFVSYHYSPDIHSPDEWTERIKFYVGWLECLAKEHTIIRLDQVNYQGNFIHNGVQYHCIDDGKKKHYFPRKLNRFVKSLSPDVVVVSSFLFPLQVIQLRKCLGSKVKIIQQHHAEKPFAGLKKLIQRYASHSVDAYLFASFQIGMHWVKAGNLADVNKIHELMEGSSVFYPVDKIAAKIKTGVQGELIFLWAGRLNENKDPLTVVKAFLKFCRFKQHAKLYMIYQTTELLNDVIQLIAEEREHPDSIVLVGPLAHQDMLYWFNSADFLVSGSHYEGSGIAVCEAMSCGCIPIVTAIPSFEMITNKGNCGLLYKAGNEEDLLEILLESTKLNREEMRINVMDHFNRVLSFRAIAEKFNGLVASL